MNSDIKPRVTAMDVASAAGVSTMSVSRAMRDDAGLSHATRARILQVAKQLGYSRDNVASALMAAHSNLIPISVPTLFDSVFAEIVHGMRSTLQRAGLDPIIQTTDYDEDFELRWVERMIAWRPAAIVLSGTSHNLKTKQLLRNSLVPTMELWEVTDDPIELCVGLDHHGAGVLIGEELLKLGYQKALFLGLEAGRDPRSDKRFEGLLASGLDVERVPVARRDPARVGAFHRATFETGALAVAQIPRDQLKPNVALVFLNDHMAIGGLVSARRSGWMVPRDFGIVGFNNLNINEVFEPTLSTVDTPLKRIGEVAARQLIARIQGVMGGATTEIPVKWVAGGTLQKVVTEEELV